MQTAEQKFNATAASMGRDVATLLAETKAKRKADARLIAARADIHDALYEAHRYFAERMDIRDGEFGPLPNECMALATKLAEAMDAAGLDHD